MKYRYEYNGNPEYVTLHITVKLVEDQYISNHAFENTSEKGIQLLAILHGVTGVVEVSIRPYSITVQYGKAFDKDEVLDNLVTTLHQWLEVEDPRQNDKWVKLLTLRSDIRLHQCSRCEQEQEDLIRDTLKDFETLE